MTVGGMGFIPERLLMMMMMISISIKQAPLYCDLEPCLEPQGVYVGTRVVT